MSIPTFIIDARNAVVMEPAERAGLLPWHMEALTRPKYPEWTGGKEGFVT